MKVSTLMDYFMDRGIGLRQINKCIIENYVRESGEFYNGLLDG